MADIFSKTKRSEVMARIRGKGNRATELRMMALFREYGITGWRRHQAVFGKPDFIFRKERVAVFVDGCFWHGCPKPKHAPLPKTNAEFWAKKLAKNKERDATVTATLQAKGWNVLRIWECDLAGKNWKELSERVKAALGRPGSVGELRRPDCRSRRATNLTRCSPAKGLAHPH